MSDAENAMLVSQLFAVKAIDKLTDKLPKGPIDPESENNFFQKIIHEEIKASAEQGVKRKKATEFILKNFFRRMVNEYFCLYSSHQIYRMAVTKKKFFELYFVCAYRNESGGARFGIDFLDIEVDNDFSKMRIRILNNKKILFSKHAIDRIYQRHAEENIKYGSEAFSKHVIAALYGAGLMLVKDEFKILQGGLFIPADGGAFLGKIEDDAYIITTFISDDDMHPDQEALSEIPAMHWAYNFMGDGLLTIVSDRHTKKRGKNCRLVMDEAWVASFSGPQRVKTAFSEE